ncbi:MAG: hypothetical protein M0R17_08710 [Candidatus Omnitrophica bacterium]|jgi:hypothetical protein|nr:hypothetical protein [Candidatus Omnitrophota bacterium]
MPATSDKQANLFRLAYSVKKGKTPRGDVSKNILDIADNMSFNKIKDFMVVEDVFNEAKVTPGKTYKYVNPKTGENVDYVAGGKSDGMSLQDLADKHNVSIEHITKQYLLGYDIEMEHTNNPKIAGEITRDHLFEDPNYYTDPKPKYWARKELNKEK